MDCSVTLFFCIFAVPTGAHRSFGNAVIPFRDTTFLWERRTIPFRGTSFLWERRTIPFRGTSFLWERRTIHFRDHRGEA